MEIFNNIIVFLIGLALFIVGRWWDIRVSRDYIYYGASEGNVLWRDKWGFFDTRKNLIFSGIFGAIGFVFLMIEELGYLTGLYFAVMGLHGLIHALLNRRSMNKTRREQKVFLQDLRHLVVNNYPSLVILSRIRSLDFIVNPNGRSWFELFAWHWTDEPEYPAAYNELADWLIELVKKPESEWFPR